MNEQKDPYVDDFGRPKRINVSFSPSVAKKLDELKLFLYESAGIEVSYGKVVEYLINKYTKDKF